MATRYKTLPQLTVIFLIISLVILINNRDEYRAKLERWITEVPNPAVSDSLTETTDTISVKVRIEPKDLAGGLVAYYPFMQNAKDASNNKNDGKPVGAKLTTDRFGNKDNAYRFNRNQFIEIKDSPSLKSIKTGVSALAWINLAQYRGFRSGIVSQDGKWALGIYRGVLVGKVYLDNGHSLDLESSQGVSLNHWNHVAMTFDGQTLALYINGRKVATKPAPGRYEIKRPKNFRLYGQPSIGRAFGVGGESFIGLIDDVFIYNRVLNETELEAIINGELPEL